MPDLEGNLKAFQPISVLQMLNLAQATGELRMSIIDNGANVWFDRGNLTFATIDNRPLRLGEYLVKEGLITHADLANALKSKGEKRLGAKLVEAAVIEEGALRRAIEEQIKEVIYQTVRWERGQFYFFSGRAPAEQDVFINIPLDHLMLEGLKRMDEETDE